MPAGASKKRERQYEKMKKGFKKEGRYKGREEEVAARVVNKQRKQFGETKAEKQKDRKGKSPDRNLPIDDYQHLTVGEVLDRTHDLGPKEIRQIKNYEKDHKNRKTLLSELDKAA